MFLAYSRERGSATDTEFLLQTLGNGNINLIHSPLGQPQIVGCSTSEIRKEKLSRYRSKKNKRNFGRKIKVLLKNSYMFMSFSSVLHFQTLESEIEWKRTNYS